LVENNFCRDVLSFDNGDFWSGKTANSSTFSTKKIQNCEFEINYNKINNLCAIFAKTFKIGEAFITLLKSMG